MSSVFACVQTSSPTSRSSWVQPETRQRVYLLTPSPASYSLYSPCCSSATESECPAILVCLPFSGLFYPVIVFVLFLKISQLFLFSCVFLRHQLCHEHQSATHIRTPQILLWISKCCHFTQFVAHNLKRCSVRNTTNFKPPQIKKNATNFKVPWMCRFSPTSSYSANCFYPICLIIIIIVLLQTLFMVHSKTVIEHKVQNCTIEPSSVYEV